MRCPLVQCVALKAIVLHPQLGLELGGGPQLGLELGWGLGLTLTLTYSLVDNASASVADGLT